MSYLVIRLMDLNYMDIMFGVFATLVNLAVLVGLIVLLKELFFNK